MADTTESVNEQPMQTIVKNAHLTRVQRTLDAQEMKIAKLQEENARLKKALIDYKAANSRVRRIPKPTGI